MNVTLPPSDEVIVAYSGGKDSIAVVELCVKAGEKVTAFTMAFLPGLDYTQYWVDYAERTWGIRVLEYQHWDTSRMLREGWYRAAPNEDIPLVTLSDTQEAVRRDTGIDWIGYGYKMTDSLARRGRLNSEPGGLIHKERLFCPLKHWTNNDVKTFISRSGLKLPPAIGKGQSSGIDLRPGPMAWLREFWPEDYRRVLKVFPYAAGNADRAKAIEAQKAESRKANSRRKRVPPDPAQPDPASGIQPETDQRLQPEAAREEPGQVRPGGTAGVE